MSRAVRPFFPHPIRRADARVSLYQLHLVDTTKHTSEEIVARTKQFQVKVKKELASKNQEVKQLKKERDGLQKMVDEYATRLQDREEQYKKLQVS